MTQLVGHKSLNYIHMKRGCHGTEDGFGVTTPAGQFRLVKEAHGNASLD